MRKLLFSVATIFATNFASGQITLEHSFPNQESATPYTDGGEMFYVAKTTDNKLKIYNADYSLKKTINVPIPSNYKLLFSGYEFDGTPFPISKHIFNIDDKIEFMVEAYYYDNDTSTDYIKLLLINEDGQLIKDFHPNAGTVNYGEKYSVYHDSTINKNKLIVSNWLSANTGDQFDVYLLPTTELSNKEIQSKNKLSAFPIPTNKILNVVNPQNGANKIEVFDTSGKLVVNKSFGISESKIFIDVENLPKGIYIYKVGDLSSKFIKN